MKPTTIGFGLIALVTFLLVINGICEFKYFNYYLNEGVVPVIDRCMFYLAWFHIAVGYLTLFKAWINNEKEYYRQSIRTFLL
ncbi:MAG: hypothetical protein LBT05_10025 [Planctomycetaceae bacterium]|jgi:hypothetical protein|nr:hypothetical protein [Planctomycetaceae bacterium]